VQVSANAPKQGTFAALARDEEVANAKAEAESKARDRAKAEAERQAQSEPPKEPISKQLIDFIRNVWQAGARAVPDPSDGASAVAVGSSPADRAPRLAPVMGFVAPVEPPALKPAVDVASEPVYADPRK
jgi:membrane protein involved in colicin uptake